MMISWYKTGGRAWWTATALVFLGLELALRIKLGSIFFLAGGFVWAHQSLAVRMGHWLPRREPESRLLFSMLAALFTGAVIFVVFTAATILVRGIDNNVRWFQLP